MITQGIFKANDIRGITEGAEPQWDEAGAFAVVVGTAITHPSSITSWFVSALEE